MNPATTTQTQLSTSRSCVALVSSNWHRELVEKARDSATQFLLQADFGVEQFDVPGAFEIPLYAKRLAKSGRYDAVIAVGLVVNGGIYRHEFVSAAVIDGLMRIQLDTDVPVFSAVLTPRDFHDHEEHRQFFRDHLVKKGEEVAASCVAALLALKKLAAVGIAPETGSVSGRRQFATA